MHNFLHLITADQQDTPLFPLRPAPRSRTLPLEAKFSPHCEPPFVPVWKTSPQPRIKPVIARDTTYGVSLLTRTICGSNFAIPRHEIRPTGMGRNSGKKRREQSATPRFGAEPEVTWHRPRANSGVSGLSIRKPGAQPLNPVVSCSYQRRSGSLEAESLEARSPLRVRWPFPDPPQGNDKN